MNITVELTEEGADEWVSEWADYDFSRSSSTYARTATALRDAIITQRPKVLQVGDVVIAGDARVPYPVLAIGTYAGQHYAVGLWHDTPVMLDAKSMTMPNGAPIAWPAA